MLLRQAVSGSARLAVLLLLGCTARLTVDDTAGKDASDADTDIDSDTDADTDADTDTDVPPVDRDADGSPEGEDCDDTDRHVFPGAAEAWDDEDGDCDGVVDGDGAWAGDIAMAATAVYEGRRYNFSLVCPFTGTRTLGVLDFAITCTPDTDDTDAQRLLGETLLVTPDDADVSGDTWEDGVVFTSSNGWDSDGEGRIAWSSFDDADVAVEMGGVSLAASGSGEIARE
ncbi:MAG: putative metal-binding motif-containing protein [Pseudomonadota bacterium]|nr:putative metal-binding motif-containing protein [Pseudomonadota bacterium]